MRLRTPARSHTGTPRRSGLLLAVIAILIGLIFGAFNTVTASAAPAPAATPQVTQAAVVAPQIAPSATKVAPKPIDVIFGGNMKDTGYGDVPAYRLCGSDGLKTIQRMKLVGLKRVGIVTPIAQKDVYSYRIKARKDTPSDACLRTAIRNVRAEGMKAEVKVFLELDRAYKKPGGGESKWRGRAHSKKPDTWFKNYGDWAIRFGRIAKAEKADMLNIGTEMKGMFTYQKGKDEGLKFDRKNPKRATAMVKRINKALSGLPLGYAAQLTDELNHTDKKFAKAFKGGFGVTVYVKLQTLSGTVTNDQIATAIKKGGYEKNVAQAAKLNGGPIIISEFGAASVYRAYLDTASEQKGKPLDLNVQKQLYEEQVKFIKGLGKKGLVKAADVWVYGTNPKDNGPKRANFTPWGKPAEIALAQLLTGYSVLMDVKPPNGSVLKGDRDVVTVRTASDTAWPKDRYRVEYRIDNRDPWTSMHRVDTKTKPYYVKTIYPKPYRVAQGSHSLNTRTVTVNGKGQVIKVVGSKSVKVTVKY